MGGGVLHSKVIGRFLDLFLSRNLPHDLPWETHFEFIVHFLFFKSFFPPSQQSVLNSCGLLCHKVGTLPEMDFYFSMAFPLMPQ